MAQNRRDFIKTIAAIGAGGAELNTVTPKKASAQKSEELSINRKGVLVETTFRVGCGKCE